MERPKTIKDLVDNLTKGIACEVATFVDESTKLKLDAWCGMDGKYKTYPSDNHGWTVYENK